MNYELDRHIEAATRKNDLKAVRALEAQKTIFNTLVGSGVVEELPLEQRVEQPSSQETKGIEVKRFSDEAREVLGKRGYKFYKLTGESVKDQMLADRRSIWIHPKRNFLGWYNEEPSMRSEVAINPEVFFLPQSNNKSISEQRIMLRDFSKNFCEEVPGVDVVMGNAADYVSLTLAHLKQERVYDERLFGQKYYNRDAVTSTIPAFDSIAIVGNHGSKGLAIAGLSTSHGYESAYVVPLVVPKYI